jgi:uncharacterized protein YydD (DUF2326 family)
VKTCNLTVKNRPVTYRTVKTVVCESSVTEQVTEITILRTRIHILSKVRKILQKKMKCLKHRCLRQKKVIKKLTKKQGKSATQVSVINNKTILELMGSFGKIQDLFEKVGMPEEKWDTTTS